MRAIPDDNLAYAVSIRLSTGASGSGFFLNTGGATLLVTAKHVFFERRSGQLSSPLATVTAYSRDLTDPQAYGFEFDLARLEAAGELRAHPSHDVAIALLGRRGGNAPLDQIALTPYVRKLASTSKGLVGVGIRKTKRMKDVLIANEVVVFGYPVSLGIPTFPQLDLRKPLLRRGVVAGRNDELKTLILDCPVYPGNSGGPVVEIERLQGATSYRVIGVVSEFVPTIDADSKVISNSGYSVVVPMDIVFELIW